jgi:hypothetical protein
MANSGGVTASMSLLSESYSKMLSYGESARAQDFVMTVVGDANLHWLIQAATTPALKREVVEVVGPFGVRSIQQGRFINEIEMAITFKEVVSGLAYTALHAWSETKAYKTVTIALKSETQGVAADGADGFWKIEDCWIELDGADLSVEDAVPLKLSGTLHGSYLPS